MLLARAGNVEIGDGRGLALIAGPCVIESEDLCMEVAARAKEITESSDRYIFQGVVRWARTWTSVESFVVPASIRASRYWRR